MNPAVENMIHSDFVRPASALFDGVFGGSRVILHPECQRYVPKEDVEKLTFLFVDLIAEVLQSYLDAGSERDVTHEDEALYEAIRNAIAGWQKEV
jgi:hypothetical protein